MKLYGPADRLQRCEDLARWTAKMAVDVEVLVGRTDATLEDVRPAQAMDGPYAARAARDARQAILTIRDYAYGLVTQYTPAVPPPDPEPAATEE